MRHVPTRKESVNFAANLFQCMAHVIVTLPVLTQEKLVAFRNQWYVLMFIALKSNNLTNHYSQTEEDELEENESGHLETSLL